MKVGNQRNVSSTCILHPLPRENCWYSLHKQTPKGSNICLDITAKRKSP